MANTKAYQWEYIDLSEGIVNVGANARAQYMEHIMKWAVKGRETRGNLMVGTWLEVGVTGTWPRCLNLWESESLHAIADRTALAEEAHWTVADKALEEWMAGGTKLRVECVCKLLLPAPWSPTLEELLARKVKGKIYYHQTVSVEPRRVEDYLSRVESGWLPIAERFGMQLVGAYRTGLRNDSEALLIWALRDFEHWAEVERASEESAARQWRESTSDIVQDWASVLLVPAPAAPLQTGKII
jgi:hypothetical protein